MTPKLAIIGPRKPSDELIIRWWGMAATPSLRYAYESGDVELTSEPNGADRNLLLGDAAHKLVFADEIKAENARDRKARRKAKNELHRVGRIRDNYVFGLSPERVLAQPALVEHFQAGFRLLERPSNYIQVVVNRKASYPASDQYGLDFEWDDGKISICGIAWDGGRSATAFSRGESNTEVIARFLAGNNHIVGHNILSADFPQAESEGMQVRPSQAFDTMLALHATHAHLAGLGSYDLRSLVLLYGQGTKEAFPLDFKRYEEDIWDTCAHDAASALYCAQPLASRIRQEGLTATLNLSQSIAPIFVRMKHRGVKLDRQVLGQIHNHRVEHVKELIASLPQIDGEPIVYRSKAILEYIQDTYSVKVADRQAETWAKVAANSEFHPELRKLADTLYKISTAGSDKTWVGNSDDGIEFTKVDADGYCHPEYQIHGSSDRPTCTGTNIQNFPRPSDDPRPVPLRAAVVPPEDGMVIISVDFGSVETYTNAIAADDWDRVRAIQSKHLSHENTARMINDRFGLALNRQQGKTCNHAFDKGETAFNLASRLFGGVRPSKQQVALCDGIYAAMLKEFPRTKQFRDQLWADCSQNPYPAVNAFGRRLLCFSRSMSPDDNGILTKTAQRCRKERWKGALAFLGRSSAVDVLLRVMVRIWEERRLDDYSLPLAEVHDELVFAVPRESVEKYSKILVDTFTEPVIEMGNIRLPAEVKWAANWAGCK